MKETTDEQEFSAKGCTLIFLLFIASIILAILADSCFSSKDGDASVAVIVFWIVFIGGYFWLHHARSERNRRAAFQKWVKEEYTPLAEKALAGDAELQYQLGETIFWRDHDRTFMSPTFWWSKAAEKGHVKAQTSLAAHYRWGHNAPVDLEKSALWYRRAAENGDCHSQLQLGDFCLAGKGVPQDLDEAVKWYKKASFNRPKTAEKKPYLSEDIYRDRARIRLALCYYSGWGVSRDEIEAYAYFTLSSFTSSDKLSDDAHKKFKALKDTLTPAQIEQGKARATQLLGTGDCSLF